MNISYSKVELYNTCAFKYYLQYIEKWSPDKTYSSLIFGSAIDQALNYVLIRTKHHHTPHYDTAVLIFQRTMDTWQGQNEFVYFKNEAPTLDTFDDLSDEDKQEAVWTNLCSIGRNIINTYITEVLPQLGTILSVQTKRLIPNEAGDNLVLVTDFRSRLLDGREITFDNKTCSDLKRYGPSSVKKSQQLAIYTEFESSRLAGYVALCKKLVDGKVEYKIRIDDIPEEMSAQAFKRVDDSLNAIKREEFPKNEKGCYSFGRLCEMYSLCKKGKTDGLIQGKKR